MSKNASELFEEMKLKMNGYAMLFVYNLMSVCIKAEPMSLLSATVKTQGKKLNLEETAAIRMPNEKQFAITPNKEDYLLPIIKAIKTEHPEFEMEEKKEQHPITNEEQTVLYLTMPAVNKDRRDACMNFIQVRYDTISAKIELVYNSYSAKIIGLMKNSPLENIEQTEKKMQELYDSYTTLIDKRRKEKEEEVEAAYQQYLEQNEFMEEEEAAIGKGTLTSFNVHEGE